MTKKLTNLAPKCESCLSCKCVLPMRPSQQNCMLFVNLCFPCNEPSVPMEATYLVGDTVIDFYYFSTETEEKIQSSTFQSSYTAALIFANLIDKTHKTTRILPKPLSWKARRLYREERRSTVKSIEQENNLGLQARVQKEQRTSKRRLSGTKQFSRQLSTTRPRERTS